MAGSVCFRDLSLVFGERMDQRVENQDVLDALEELQKIFHEFVEVCRENSDFRYGDGGQNAQDCTLELVTIVQRYIKAVRGY